MREPENGPEVGSLEVPVRSEVDDGRFAVEELPSDGVSVIVVTHRGAGHVEACVAALRRAVPGVPAELIIVHDGSDDDTVKAARAAAPDARVVETGEDGGFAKGCHAGVAHARGHWLVFVTPDALPAPGSVRALVDCAKAEPQAGIVGGRCLTDDGTNDPRTFWGKPGLWSAFCFGTLLSSLFPGSRWFDPEAPRPWSSEVQQVPVVTGGFMLVSRRAWEDTGGFDMTYFRYGEDADLCLRASDLGYRPTVTGRAIFRHEGGEPPCATTKLVQVFTGKATVMRRHVGPGAVRLLLLGVYLRAKLGRVARARPGRQGRSAVRAEDWHRLWKLRRDWSKGWPRETPTTGPGTSRDA
jgi:N-acetylglucosaminyl-diphospho-decaprenol L-rhamnosyltransferase